MQRIVLDCDPGHDDAIAILLAARSPQIKLEAITTVAGNQTVEKTTLNARKVCTLAGIRDVPIAAGMSRPLAREQLVAADIHGASGLDGPDLPEPDIPFRRSTRWTCSSRPSWPRRARSRWWRRGR